MSRPEKIINWDEVDRLLIAQCKGTEIAAHFGMHPDTLYDRCKRDHKVGFSDYSQQKQARGRALLRLQQFHQAMRGDRGMLIWLGKNYLNQRDKQDVEHNAESKIVVVNYNDTHSQEKSVATYAV